MPSSASHASRPHMNRAPCLPVSQTTLRLPQSVPKSITMSAMRDMF